MMYGQKNIKLRNNTFFIVSSMICTEVNLNRQKKEAHV